MCYIPHDFPNPKLAAGRQDAALQDVVSRNHKLPSGSAAEFVCAVRPFGRGTNLYQAVAALSDQQDKGERVASGLPVFAGLVERRTAELAVCAHRRRRGLGSELVLGFGRREQWDCCVGSAGTGSQGVRVDGVAVVWEKACPSTILVRAGGANPGDGEREEYSKGKDALEIEPGPTEVDPTLHTR